MVDTDQHSGISKQYDQFRIGEPRLKNKDRSRKSWVVTTPKNQWDIKALIKILALILICLCIGIAGKYCYTLFFNGSSLFQDPNSEANKTISKDVYNKDIVNIVLIGTDFATERAAWNKEVSADTIMLVAINIKENKASILSIPRDTYAEIYNTPGNWRIASSFSSGGGYNKDGPLYVVNSVQKIMGGIPIDYYMGIDIPAFKDIVDAIGGIDFNVDVSTTIQGRSLHAGTQHLDGQQAMDYCRVRKGIDDDLGRISRQRQLFLAIFNKLKSQKDLTLILKITDKLQGKIHTNLSLEQISALAVMISKIKDENISMKTLEGNMTPIFNWNYYIINQGKKQQLIEDVYGISIDPDKGYNFEGAMKKWAIIQANQYAVYVKDILKKYGGQLTGSNEALLNQCIQDVVKAITNGKTDQIMMAKDTLKRNTDNIIKASGIPPISWYVNENPVTK